MGQSGLWASIVPSSRYGKLACLSMAVDTIAILGLHGWVLAAFFRRARLDENTSDKTTVVYMGVFMAAAIFQLVMIWDSVRHKNTVQLLGFLFLNICASAYAIFENITVASAIRAATSSSTSSTVAAALDPLSLSHNFRRDDVSQPITSLQLDDAEKANLLAVLATATAVMLSFTAVFCALTYLLYLEFGWSIYKELGADPIMKNMFRSYSIFLTLLKLDFFFIFGFGAQFLALVIKPNDPEFGITLAAFPALLIVMAFASYGVRTEKKAIVVAFILGLLLAAGYFAFKMFRIFTRPEQYQVTKKYLIFFATFCLIVIIATISASIACLMNFGKGLSERVTARSTAAVTGGGASSSPYAVRAGDNGGDDQKQHTAAAAAAVGAGGGGLAVPEFDRRHGSAEEIMSGV